MASASRCIAFAFILGSCVQFVSSWRAYVPWDTRQWCEQVVSPRWPFAYRKAPSQILELKGRTVSNLQDFRYDCVTRGAFSVCHRCEPFICGAGVDAGVCNFQLQGISWLQLPSNIPTVTDTPFAVGPNVTHRNDFGNAERVCLFTQGAECIQHNTTDFSACALRCWGKSYVPPTPFALGWTYPKDQGLPQGRAFTLAGAGVSGFANGVGTAAKFNNPQAVAIDIQRNVYVADMDNHCIRMITPAGVVTTFAGLCETAGFRDGPLSDARFSSPSGITLYHNASDNERLTIYVSDTANHRIRRIRREPVRNGTWEVVTWAGGRSTQIDSPLPASGLQDGMRTSAAFNFPRGLAVDETNAIYVADTNNHLIRYIDPSGNVSVLAGTVVSQANPVAGQLPADPGCLYPCQVGVPGFNDGPRLSAKFSYPQDVSIGTNQTVYVVGDNRLRRITRSNTTISLIQGIRSFNRVETIAGALTSGRADGLGYAARFEAPKGVMMAPSGRIFVADSLQCRLRRVTPTQQVARPLTCNTRLVDIIRPSGCSMYDPPTDVFDRLGTQVANHIYFQENQTTTFTILKCLGTPPPTIGPTSSGYVSSSSFGDGTVSAGGGSTGFTTFSNYEQTDYGTTYRVSCPAGCYKADVVATDTPLVAMTLWGFEYYADISRICAAGGQMGLIDNAGGIFEVRVEKGWGPNADNSSIGFKQPLAGATYNFIRSDSLPGWDRTFTVRPYLVKDVEVYTMAGIPTAPLDDACGYRDGQPPSETRYDTPSGLGMFYRANLSDTEFVYIADSGNHVIRAMTAVCSLMCENGGRCVADETCACASGWTGIDCTTPTCSTPCGQNMLCVGGQCVCKPGYGGFQCLVAQCVQTCVHGVCRAPDTCFCETGWFDSNCTTPVCSVTCGNGGNCTNPNDVIQCTCPSEWTGDECRTPVCAKVQCVNGGKCIAPDTCWCPPEWSGHDCSKPVCLQGYFRPDPAPQHFAPPSYNDISVRPKSWQQYLPCDYPDWCASTNEFDCAQLQRHTSPGVVDLSRIVTGFHSWGGDPGGGCFEMELAVDMVTNYRYDVGDGTISPYLRNQSNQPYRAQSVYNNKTAPWSAPNPTTSDRQVPLVQYLNVTQGVYVCANGGNCTAPGLCHCAPGWVGFDCRTPICSQGWYDKYRPPVNTSSGLPTRWALDQGSYVCSHRSLTIWENPDLRDRYSGVGQFRGYIHNHPNYYSHYMDNSVGWLPVHQRMPGLGNNTVEGWRRDGWWQTNGNPFRKGDCLQLYSRTCPGDLKKQASLITGSAADPVTDIEANYGPIVTYFNDRVAVYGGEWSEIGGECVDHIMSGCFNNGTCVAPDTCVCAPGWEGHDCSLPVCRQSIGTVVAEVNTTITLLRANGTNVGDATGLSNTPRLPGDSYVQYRKCKNNGNCTLPDTCTCEKGWTGDDCTIPMCAQECFNGGYCFQPDDCMCATWPSKFKDGRSQPLFRKDNGDPQDTGWTGYDCNTPICVNAQRFVLNGVGKVKLIASANNGSTFEGGCPNATRYTPAGRSRVSPQLCNVSRWYQGVFKDTWANALTGLLPFRSDDSRGRVVRPNFDNYIRLNADKFVAGPIVRGEGVFACYNNGSCVAPDMCECADGWAGGDCSSPLCRHRNVYSEVVSCLHHGICGSRDKCTCPQQPSLLHLVHWTQPRQITGYTGTDCGIAMCSQGFFDATCKNVPGGRSSVSAGGEGCYRCANGGNCTSPDYCTCPPNWTGFDCRTPVCTQQATPAIIVDLNTVDPLKIAQFELDPCGQEFTSTWRGMTVGRGNCSMPDICTCFCSVRSYRDGSGALVVKPWKDQVSFLTIPVGYRYGSYDCLDGWEGLPDTADPNHFKTCHLQIFVPSWLRKHLLIVAGGIAGGLVLAILLWIIIRRRLRQKYLLAKAERRRSRRSSEEERQSSAVQ